MAPSSEENKSGGQARGILAWATWHNGGVGRPRRKSVPGQVYSRWYECMFAGKYSAATLAEQCGKYLTSDSGLLPIDGTIVHGSLFVGLKDVLFGDSSSPE